MENNFWLQFKFSLFTEKKIVNQINKIFNYFFTQ